MSGNKMDLTDLKMKVEGPCNKLQKTEQMAIFRIE